MKKLYVLLGCLLSVASMAGHSSLIFTTDLSTFEQSNNITQTEDFELFDQKNAVLGSFTLNNVLYQGHAGGTVAVTAPGFVNFGVPITTSSILTASGKEDFMLNFSMDVNSIGFDTYLNKYGPAEISIFGVNGLLGSYSLSHDPSLIGFFGVSSTVNITSVGWVTTNGAVVNTGIDNIRIGGNAATSVPEPSTFIMFFIAISLLFMNKIKSYLPTRN